MEWGQCGFVVDHVGARAVRRNHSTACRRRSVVWCACSEAEFQTRVREELIRLQDHVCDEVSALDGGGEFVEDRFEDAERNKLSIARVLEDGALLEKAAVNITAVNGNLSPGRAAMMRSRGRDFVSDESPYFAVALSIVLHPQSPMVPTLRGDIRLFQLLDGGSVGWMGGGADLTPCYLFEEDAEHFHKFWRATCDEFDPAYYPKFKALCDDYFYIPMRKEHRGVGGIFFEDIELGTEDKNLGMPEFLRSVASGWIPSWAPIVSRRRGIAYDDEQRSWQLLRRGRYLEFNLLYDRGVRAGLLSDARTESIMVSAPPLIAWKYNVQPKEGSPEDHLIQVLRNPRAWA